MSVVSTGTNEATAVQPIATSAAATGTNEATVRISALEEDTSSESNSLAADNISTKASALPPLVHLTQCIECCLPLEPTYLCKGCLKAIHCFCAVNKEEELGHGAHYWCKACHAEKQREKTWKQLELDIATNSGTFHVVTAEIPGSVLQASRVQHTK
jgi:hypothetical protein